MRTPGAISGRVWILTAAAFLTSCATTTPSQKFRTFFIPPAHPAPPSTPAIDLPNIAPAVGLAFYAGEVPNLTASLPALPRPSDAEFLIKRADDRFAAGKRAFQEGRIEDARREFDRALEILLTAPENLPDRSRLEAHAEELAEGIYRYDADQLGAGQPEGEVSYEKSPLDSILEMTFPVDPALRNKVQEQIRVTASQLPLEQSDAVVSYINFFSTPRGKKILASGLRRAGRYKPMIERILGEEGLPQELIFVAQAESGFQPRAMSNKKCVGLWQFATFRGREYGLNQALGLDDRMDPEQATRAAAHHLRDLYTHFGNWNLALAAYNCGPGCVDHAVMRTGYADFWTLRRLNVLPKETSNYVPVILAMTIMSKNAKDYGLDDLETDKALEYETIELEAPTHLALIAEAVDRPISEIRELNPSLLRPVAPAGHALHVPKDTLGAVQVALQAVPANRRDAWRVHRLEGGETFATVAKRYGAAPSAVSLANHDELPEAGSWIAIPAAYPGDRPPGRVAAASHPAGGQSAKRKSAPRTAARRTKTPVRRSAAGSHAPLS
jgi:membrane-bound lytic murein transglycosylase D